MFVLEYFAYEMLRLSMNLYVGISSINISAIYTRGSDHIQ